MYEGVSDGDLSAIFSGSIVLLKKKPFYVMDVDAHQLIGRVAGKEGAIGVDASSEDLQFYGMNTGNVNIQGSVLYMTRRPIRMYKQGLHRDNVKFIYDRDSMAEHHRFLGIRDLKSKAVAQTVLNSYPTFKHCLEKVNEAEKEMAFDRQFSINDKGILLMRKQPVGKVDMNNGKLTFKRGKQYLKYALGEKYENL